MAEADAKTQRKSNVTSIVDGLRDLRGVYSLHKDDSKHVLAVTVGSYKYRDTGIHAYHNFKPTVDHHVVVNPSLAIEDSYSSSKDKEVRHIIDKFWKLMERRFFSQLEPVDTVVASGSEHSEHDGVLPKMQQK